MTTPSPRTRITREQRHHLLQTIKALLGMHKHPSEIKRVVSKEFQLSPRSVERYITRARREMVESVTVPLEQMRAEAYHFYLYKLSNTKLSEREQIRCRERMDKLLGLDTPTQPRKKRFIRNLTLEKIQNMSVEELKETRKLIHKDYCRMTGQPYPKNDSASR
ncbi:hypothetical protein [Gimesia sp.]|uniref:hypothetical protein n=1 Tax=Gimesia sp. TaxID=2024833 RepID=UPI003A95B770